MALSLNILCRRRRNSRAPRREVWYCTHACRKDFTPSRCLDSIVSTFSLIPGM